MARAGLDADAVVAAAAGVADERGLDGLTLALLARGLGVKTPSLYAHIDGLADLRVRLATRGARELAASLHRAAGGRARGEALRAVADAYRAYAHAHPGTYAALQVPSADPEHGAAAQEVIVAIAAVLRGYGIEGDEAIHAIRVIRSALHGFVALEQIGGFALALRLDDSYERLVEMLDAGLTARASPAPSGPPSTNSPAATASG